MKYRICFLIFFAVGTNSYANKTEGEIKKLLSNMDSRLSVDGKGVCFFYADHNASNRCEAIQRCTKIGSDHMRPIVEYELKNKNFKEAVRVQTLLASLYSYKEKTLPEGLEEYKKAYEMAEKSKDPETLNLLAKVGIVEMRLAEIKNCINNHNERSCIFPLDKKAVHKDKEYAKAAAATFRQYLNQRPSDDHIRWLYNIVHMALGTYPKAVEKKYLIDKGIFKSEISFPNFRDYAKDFGISSDESFGGSLIDDLDNDGKLEIIIGSINPCDSLRYYKYIDGKYVNIAGEAGIDNQKSVGNIYQADINNDGLLDLYLTRGAWHPGGSNDPRIKQVSFIPIPEGSKTNVYFNTLLLNKGDNKFEDITEKAGLRTLPNSSLTAVWRDFNNDGWVDVFVCNEFRQPDLFINEKGKFKDMTSRSGITNNEICKGVVAADVNNDGYEDLFLSNYYGDKVLYINNKDLTFTRLADSGITDFPKYSFTPFFFDYNNDGKVDLFVEAFAPNVDNFIAAALKKKHNSEPPRLFENRGNGKFEDVTYKVGLDRITQGMSANYGDIDNDGYDEIFLGTGANGFGDLMPNLMFKNMEGKKFADISVVGGFSSLQKGHGISFADINNDGHMDVFIQMGGSSLADRFFPSLYINPKNKNSWIKIKLEGKKSNRAALGAKIKFVTDKQKTFYHTVSSGGSFGSNPLWVHMGLGETKKINEIVISWPSGEQSVFKNVNTNQSIKIVEGIENFEDFKIVEIPLPSIDKNSVHEHH